MSCLGTEIIEELVLLGVTHFCISPGSRSTPLTQAIALHPDAQSYIFIDERSASFFALGIGKATGTAAAVITTSGTAISNGFPALIEADQSSIRLLFVSADRPPELRSSGSNQTIDQVKLFSDHVRSFLEIAPQCPEIDPTTVEEKVSSTVFKCSHAENKGPVHINILFREPFALPSSIHAARTEPHIAWNTARQRLSHTQELQLKELLFKSQETLLLIGELSSPSDRIAALELAHKLNCTTICDVSSGLSLFPIPNKLPAANILFEHPTLSSVIHFDLVIHLGGNTVAKDLPSKLKYSNYVHIDPRPKTISSTSLSKTRWLAPLRAVSEATSLSASPSSKSNLT